MKDVNFPLRKSYFSKLNGLVYNGTPIKAFYQKAPSNITDANYIVFGGINSNDVSGKSKADTDTTIRVSIHTHKDGMNDGAAADAIAGLVLNAIYSTPTSVLDITSDGLQCVTTSLSGDITLDYAIFNTREKIDRILTFNHRIFHK